MQNFRVEYDATAAAFCDPGIMTLEVVKTCADIHIDAATHARTHMAYN